MTQGESDDPLAALLTSADSWDYGNPGATLSVCTLKGGLWRDSRPAALVTVLVTAISYSPPGSEFVGVKGSLSDQTLP